MKIKSHLFIRNISFVLVLTLFSLLSIKQAGAQVGQIDLPQTNGGNMPLDILVANSKVFVYTGSKIMVYNSGTMSYAGEIILCNKDYGKFNPLFYNARLHGETNMMALNKGRNELFVVTPDLVIKRYSTISLNYIDEIAPPESISHFKPIHGLNILKFDRYHNRLYWVVKGKIGNHENGGNFNGTGGFHVRERYFAIFNVNPSDGSLSLHFSEQRRAKILGKTGDAVYNRYINSSISDIAFNRSNNKFYLTKLNKLETWEVTTSSAQRIDSIIIDPSYYCGAYYKFGQIKYIYETHPGESEPYIHKIVALPYRYPSSTKNCTPLMVVLDGEDGSHQLIQTASRKILDAEYLSTDDELLLCFAPDNDEIVNTDDYDSDIAVYEFNEGDNEFETSPSQVFSTNQQGGNKSAYDMNTSFDLVKLNNSNALVLKKDQVNKIYKSNGSYTWSQWFEAEGNHFMKGISSGAKLFVTNLAGSGIEVFSAAGEHLSISKKMGYSTNKIVANTLGSKMYIFHQLNNEKTGLYVHDVVANTTTNLNHDADPNNNIDGMIGDVVYNPYENQFLISQSIFETETYNIRIINNDNSNGGTITLPSSPLVTHPKEMFIAPDKRLYVMANMLNKPGDPSFKPKILVYRATEEGSNSAYTLIFTGDLNVAIPQGYAEDYEYYSAYFAYNASLNKVYASIHPTEYTFDQYSSTANSMSNFGEVYPPPNLAVGRVVSFSEDAVENVASTLAYPGKILCPNAMGAIPNSQFANKLFVIGEDFYEYDFSPNGQSIEHTGLSYNNIIYCPEQDVLFALKDVEDDNCDTDRHVQIDKITYNGTSIDFTKVAEIGGQAAAFFYNPYNMKVYIHMKFDDKKLAATNVSLYKFDPSENPITVQLVEDLGMTSFYPELDHCPDFRFFYYSFNQPYINPYNNKIYLPNGAHSKVSVVDFDANEALFLEADEWNWLSFPRTNSDPQEAISVVDGNILPQSFTWSHLENLPFGTTDPLNVEYLLYNGSNWNTGGNLTNIHNVRGHKLQFHKDELAERHLYLHGTVTDPSTAIQLYGDSKENWTGYWLYQSQDIFDAMGSKANYFYLIKHEDWTCVMSNAWTFPGGTPPPNNLVWECDKKVHNIQYGEMVVLKSLSDGFIPFQWTFNGQIPAGEDPTQNPAYYTAQEQADYTPMIIELDSADYPVEIGAFINDTCIGATVVESGDSVVAVRTYLDGSPGDSVVFEKYYGTKSIARNRIGDYYVWNREKRLNEKRAIHAGERQDHYFVSFKKQKLPQAVDASPLFNIWPNPASTILFCSLTLDNDEIVNILIMDITGNPVTELLHENLNSGQHRLQFSLADDSGRKLKPGIYLVKIKAGQMMKIKMLIVK